MTDPHAAPPGEAHNHAHGGHPPREEAMNWPNFWVFVGAVTSGMLSMLVMAFFLGAYYWDFLPLRVQPAIVAIWPILMLGYVVMQIAPMIVRYQTAGPHVAIDQYSTFAAALGTIVVLSGWGFGVLSINADGRWVMLLTVMTNVIDFLLLPIGNKMISASRDEV